MHQIEAEPRNREIQRLDQRAGLELARHQHVAAESDALPGDQFLLASDGLTRLVNDRELLAELSAGSVEGAADRLIDMVLARGAPDNVSLVIATVG